MNRPDLVGLTDEDLIRATSVGLLQRARRESKDENLSAVGSWEGEGVVVRWSDGMVCRFPPGRSLQGECSCAASTLCRHLLRSILWLREHPLPANVPAEPVQKPRKKTRSAAVDDLLAMTRAEFEKWVGKSSWSKAIRFLSEHPPTVEDQAARKVIFPTSLVTISFPAGSNGDGAVCICQQSMPCPHVVPALLALRGEAAEHVATDSVSPSIEDDPPSWGRVNELLKDLLVCGLDGLSPAWSFAARTTALELEKRGIERVAKGLERLAQQVDEQRTGHRPFRPSLFRRDLASAWLEWELSRRPDALEEMGLLPTEATRWRRPTTRTLVGVGARAWWTEDRIGLTVFMQDVATGDMLTSGTARPMELGLEPEDLARSTLFAEVFAARDLLGRMFICRNSSMSDDGKLRGVKEKDVELQADGVDWLTLSHRTGVDRWDRLSDRASEAFPSIITHWRPEVQWIIPARHEEAWFDSARQTLCWPIYDQEGRRLQLEYDYRVERADMIEKLKQASQRATPLAILARYRSIDTLRTAEPISILYAESTGIKLWVIDLQSRENRAHGRGKIF